MPTYSSSGSGSGETNTSPELSCQGLRPIIGSISPSTFIWSLDYNGDWCLEAPGEQIQFGLPGDTPLVGDWDADGRAKAGVWRLTNGKGYFFFDANGNGDDASDPSFQWGITGDIPVVGDWNGKGYTEAGVFRPNGGNWFLDANNSHSVLQASILQFGLQGDTPIVGDWSGNGLSKVGVWRVQNGVGYFFLDLNGNGYDASDPSFQWGQAGDIL